MAAPSVIVLDDSDDDEIQVLQDATAGDPVFCQICHICLNDHPIEARQAHYEHHFGEEGNSSRSYNSVPGPVPQQIQSNSATSSSRNESMHVFRRVVPPNEDAFWYSGKSGPIPKNCSPGLVSVLKQALLKSHSKGQTTRAALCADGVVHVSTQSSDRMWGCGYRNFLMSCTALMSQDSRPNYIPQLMKDPSPGVRNLQRWIEAAWSAGLDKEGEADLKPLVDSTKWIGTVEISVAFSYRRIPTKLVDFPDVDKSADIVTDWIVAYFDGEESENSKPILTALTAEKKTVGEVLRRASPVKVTDRMPLILQHQGHSRTIVGYEVMKSGGINLLTFDPAKKLNPTDDIRQAGLSKFQSQQQSHATTSTSSGSTKRKHIMDRLFHPRSIHSTTSADYKGKKRQASPSPGPNSLSNAESRQVKRVRGGLQSVDDTSAVGKAVEVIDVDDDDDVKIIDQASSNGKSTTSSPVAIVDHQQVLRFFRLQPKNVGKKNKYQILYFTLDDLLNDQQIEERKTVHATPVKRDTTKGKRNIFNI